MKSKLDPEGLGIVLLGPFLLEFFPDQVTHIVLGCAESLLPPTRFLLVGETPKLPVGRLCGEIPIFPDNHCLAFALLSFVLRVYYFYADLYFSGYESSDCLHPLEDAVTYV